MANKLILGLLLILLLPSVSAVAIGVNKASVTFDNVLRGGFARETLTITTDSEELVSAEVLLQGDAAEWLNFSDMEFNFSRDQPYVLAVDVQPPLDAEVRDYKINMSIMTGELLRSGGSRLGTSTRASLGVPITLKMTGNEIATCKVGGLRVHDSETDQPLQVELSVINTGNVRLNPLIEIEVLDKFRVDSQGVTSQRFGSSIFPTLTRETTRFFNFDLPAEQYWASVKVPQCEYVGIATFDILAPGGVKDDGEFIRIDAPVWVETGDIVRVAAIFRNRGVRAVRAEFKGTITDIDAEQIVKVIDTDSYLVDPDATAEIETFFNPQQAGRFMITGKIFYNEKLTAEKNAVINVNGPGLAGVSFAKGTLFLVAIIIVILVLLVLIRKKKSRPQKFHPRRKIVHRRLHR